MLKSVQIQYKQLNHNAKAIHHRLHIFSSYVFALPDALLQITARAGTGEARGTQNKCYLPCIPQMEFGMQN